jgi:hypothetical protein
MNDESTHKRETRRERGGGVSEYGKHGLARMKQTQIHAGRWSGMPGDDEAKGL